MRGSKPRYQRARRPVQKEERREAILQAADRLAGTSSYSDLTIASLARHTGLVRGTIYLYFATREEILLTLFERRVTAWTVELMRRLDRIRGKADAGKVSRTISHSLVEKRRLLELSSLFQNVIEPGVEPEHALAVKRNLIALGNQAGKLIEISLPSLKSGDGLRVLRQAWALLTGLAQMADLSPRNKAIYSQDSTLAAMEIDLDKEFDQALLALVQGYLSLREQRK